MHDTYSRLDYILVDHEILEYVVEASIGIISISDHAPVTVKIKFNEKEYRKGTWRLNEDLIDDVEVEKIMTEIEQYFSTNDTPDVTKVTIWEAHKAYVRGKFISIGAGKKKERERTMKNVIKELHELEQKHKIQLYKETHQKIVIKRGHLRDLMEQETRKVFKNVANKPGKYLAKISKEKKPLNYIEQIKNEKGEIKYKTTDIAKVFKTYYSALYAIRNKETRQEEESRKSKI